MAIDGLCALNWPKPDPYAQAATDGPSRTVCAAPRASMPWGPGPPFQQQAAHLEERVLHRGAVHAACGRSQKGVQQCAARRGKHCVVSRWRCVPGGIGERVGGLDPMVHAMHARKTHLLCSHGRR